MSKKFNIKITLLISVSTLFITSCTTVPITGRKQFSMVSDAMLLPMAFEQYKGFLKENKISTNIEMTNQIKAVGQRISEAVDRYMRAHGMVSKANAYRWEFNLIDDEKVNAWAMPGGKTVFYTGIMPIAKNEDGIAAIMGHEIAHAFARHGAERMSVGMLQQFGGMGVALATDGQKSKQRQIWMAAYGATSQLGSLKFSRTHESEADKLGVVFMIMAGYDPEEAVLVWTRMSQRSDKQKNPPEFLSTHPSNQTRIRNLKAWIPEAKILAKKLNKPH
ncbi:Zn-dependent protease with chaperone function PA4632 [hydrothermal vent metagenome]|uniref:Zn-dependent protease with chaperone function PA4632 n=1 Tax=hydrothermal vent metagenome TaxID=652676 RepID=A0A3B1E552_9ZZZZ